MADLKKLYESVVSADAKRTQAITMKLAEGRPFVGQLDIVPAMDEVGRRFGANEYFVPNC
jgi:hypothetical protein